MNVLDKSAKKLTRNPFPVFALLFFSLVAASALAGFTPQVQDYVELNAQISQVVPSWAFWGTMLASGILGCVGIVMIMPRLVSIVSMAVVLGHSFIFFVLLYTEQITSQAVRSPWIVMYAAYIFFIVGAKSNWWDD